MDNGISFTFDVEDEKERMLERECIKELMEKEESKLFDTNDYSDDTDSFFNCEGYQALIKECGFTPQESNEKEDVETSDSSQMDYKYLSAKMTDISDGQKLIFKRLISKGEGSKVPEGALVIYNYKFYHEYQDEPFDSTRFKKRPDRQRVGVGQLLPGLDVALQSMSKKEKANFIFDSSVMFGELGVPPRIPGAADIYAEVEVIDFTGKNLIDEFFEKTAEEKLELSFQDLIDLVVQCRDDANAAVRNKRYAVALFKYARGLDILYAMPITVDDEELIRWNHVAKLTLNMAHCNLQLNRGPQAIKCCNTVLNKQPTNAKALYRKGKGLMIIGEYDDAAKYLKNADKHCPNNKEILNSITENEELKHQYREIEKLLAKNMLETKNDNVIQPKIVKTPDLNCEQAIDIRNQIRNFIDTEEIKTLSNLKGLSSNEIDIIKAICDEYNLHFNEKDGIIRKKQLH